MPWFFSVSAASLTSAPAALGFISFCGLTVLKGTIVTREMLLNHLYGGTEEPELKIIDVFVCKLRKKLAQATGGDHSIETVWGRGYMLRDPAANGGHPNPRPDGRWA